MAMVLQLLSCVFMTTMPRKPRRRAHADPARVNSPTLLDRPGRAYTTSRAGYGGQACPGLPSARHQAELQLPARDYFPFNRSLDSHTLLKKEQNVKIKFSHYNILIYNAFILRHLQVPRFRGSYAISDRCTSPFPRAPAAHCPLQGQPNMVRNSGFQSIYLRTSQCLNPTPRRTSPLRSTT